ncbi:MAG: hypothetical protein ACLFPF_02070 [Halanaerobiales bacterium]
MGAVAFYFFGVTLDRSIEKWIIEEDYYEVALRTVSENRDDRYNSVKEFYEAWVSCI